MAERVDTQGRLQALRKLLVKEEASTQDELREELEKLDYEVNQSTISRDLRKLGAIKMLDTSGRTVYRLAEEMAPVRPPSGLGTTRILENPSLSAMARATDFFSGVGSRKKTVMYSPAGVMVAVSARSL